LNALLTSVAVIFCATFFADSVDLEGVPGGEIAVLKPDLTLELADFLGEKFNRVAALGAHHVVMAAPVVLVLVTGDAVVEGHFAGQATLGQQFQRAVDGGVANAGVFFLNQAMEFVGRKVIAGIEKGPQDGIALRRLLQSDPLKVAMKDFLRFAHHLAREGGLIIDASLQHGGGTESSIPSGILKMKFIFTAGAPRMAWNTIKDSR
jgi:hypothetical protein